MRLRTLQFLVLGLVVLFWYVMTAPGLIPPFYFDKANRAAFFFGEPQKVFWVIVDWFATGEIFGHLAITLLETALGFLIGAVFGLVIGFLSAWSDQYISARWTNAIVFSILILVLVFRPQGLMGERTADKA